MSRRITFDGAAYGRSHEGNPELGFAERLAAFNAAQHRRSMAATLRWADKLANEGRKRLPNANWWHGEPYGTRPASVSSWATQTAKKNPARCFHYTPGTVDKSAELAKLGGRTFEVKR